MTGRKRPSDRTLPGWGWTNLGAAEILPAAEVLPQVTPGGDGGLLEGLDEAALALPARKLSGGQKRRTALLRALWAPGNTLLLDEPFTGMDPAAVQASIALLRERVEGRPVLLATHDRAAIDALGWPMLELQKLAQPGAACNSTNKGLQ